MKKFNLAVLLVAAPLLLASCDKVSAKFTQSNEPLTNAVEIDHNTLNVIFKKIKDGGSYSSAARDLLVNALAKAVIGDYKVVADTTATRGYKVVLDDYEKATDKAAYIKSHDAYKNWNHTGYKLFKDEGEVSQADFEQRVEYFKSIIEKQFMSTLWGEANTSSYKRNNRFYEKLYAKAMNDKLYTLTKADGKTALSSEEISKLYENPDYTSHMTEDVNGEFVKFKANDDIPLADGLFTNGVLIDYTFDSKTESGLDNISKAIHVPYYLEYVNESIIPTILNNLLVEQYIIEEQYSAIGTTQKRNVNFLKIDDNNTKNGEKFIGKILSKALLNTDEALYEDLKGKSVGEVFTWAQETWKALPDQINADSEQGKLAIETFGAIKSDNPSAHKDGHAGLGYIQDYHNEDGTVRPITYFEHTDYYDLVEKYSTLTHDHTTNNSSNTSSFTSIDSVSYDPIVGLAIKTDELRIKDFITTDWQTKDSSTLPSTAKDKLYSYSFANEWNSALEANKSGKAYIGSYIYQVKSGDSFRTFLMKDNYNSVVDSVLWADSSSFYVVEITDLITPDTIAIESDADSSSKKAIEKKVRETAYTLASGSTYTTNAVTFYLEKSNIKYHDQDVYDFFNSNYPKLFEKK